MAVESLDVSQASTTPNSAVPLYKLVDEPTPKRAKPVDDNLVEPPAKKSKPNESTPAEETLDDILEKMTPAKERKATLEAKKAAKNAQSQEKMDAAAKKKEQSKKSPILRGPKLPVNPPGSKRKLSKKEQEEQKKKAKRNADRLAQEED